MALALVDNIYVAKSRTFQKNLLSLTKRMPDTDSSSLWYWYSTNYS